MTDDLTTQLAVLLRGVQWEVNEVAFRLPGEGVTKRELTVLADRLSVVADLLRAHAAGISASDDL